MAFAIQYQENMYPLDKWFYSDDPFKSLRGSNDADPWRRFKVIDIEVGDVEAEINTSSLRGRAGRVFNSKERRTRPINISFDAWANSTYSVPMLRDFIQHIFDTKEPFHFYEDWRPEGERPKDVAINSKYYEVLKTDLSIQKIGSIKLRVTVDLVTAELPYGISTGSTEDIIKAGGIKFSTGLFGWQEWLQFDDTKYSYRIDMVPGQTYKVFNPSTKKVKHFEACLHLKIRNFSNIQGNGVLIRNKTNGTYMYINAALNSNTLVEQRDSIIWRNGFNELDKAHANFVELETGWNDLEIESVNAQVDFLFRFYN